MTITVTYDAVAERLATTLASHPEGLNPQDEYNGSCQYTADRGTIQRPNTQPHCAIGQMLVDLGLSVPDGSYTENAASLLQEMVNVGELRIPQEAIDLCGVVQNAADGQYLSSHTLGVPDTDVYFGENEDENGVTVPRPWGLVADLLPIFVKVHRDD